MSRIDRVIPGMLSYLRREGMKETAILCLCALLTCALSFADADADKELFRISKLTEILYRIEYAPPYNFVHLASVGEDGILLIDSGMGETAPALLDELKKLGNGHITYIINTHAHADHIGGNPVFAKEAPVIAHANVKKRYSPPFYHLPPIQKEGAPNITFVDTMNLFFNGESIIVHYMLPGHSDGDALVYFPGSNILYMGDLIIHGRFSTVDPSLGGDVDGFMDNLSTLISDYPEETRFFPAHGPEYSKQDLIEYRQAFVKTLIPIEKELKKGKTVEEIVSGEVFSDYQDWLRKADWVEVIQARLGKKDPPSICEPLTRVLVEKNIQETVKMYFELKTNSRGEFLFAESQLNAFGYQLLRRERVNEAITIFKLNTTEYPGSSNVYDSLGEAYLLKGDLSLAEHNFKKALELDPDNVLAKEHLEQLQKMK